MLSAVQAGQASRLFADVGSPSVACSSRSSLFSKDFFAIVHPAGYMGCSSVALHERAGTWGSDRALPPSTERLVHKQDLCDGVSVALGVAEQFRLVESILSLAANINILFFRQLLGACVSPPTGLWRARRGVATYGAPPSLPDPQAFRFIPHSILLCKH